MESDDEESVARDCSSFLQAASSVVPTESETTDEEEPLPDAKESTEPPPPPPCDAGDGEDSDSEDDLPSTPPRGRPSAATATPPATETLAEAAAPDGGAARVCRTRRADMSRAAADARAALRDGCPVDALDDNGLTALHLAAFNGVAEVVEALVEAGGPNFVARESRGGMNVLHFATGAGASDDAFPFVAALFAAAPRTLLLGLSLAREHQGQLTPKDRAVLNGHERLALLFGAVERLDDAEVERILATACAPPPPPLPRARSRPAAAAARPRRRPCRACGRAPPTRSSSWRSSSASRARPRSRAPPMSAFENTLLEDDSDGDDDEAMPAAPPLAPPARVTAAAPPPHAPPPLPRSLPPRGPGIAARQLPNATFAPIANPDQRRPSPPKPRAASSGQSSMNLQQLLQDVVQQLGKEERIRFREFVQELKAKRDAGEIPSLSEALLAGGENVVGNDVWRRACAKQDARARSSSEEAEEGRARPPEPRARPAEPRARPREPPAAPRAPKRRRFEAVPANAVVIDIGDSDDDAPPPPNRPHVIDLT
ncbi:hypothetical protein JL721_2611 [Aureococcus anophagefferens]|nr:hypothetical protein JL721_2611 [Aureococcus anophagefferens]